MKKFLHTGRRFASIGVSLCLLTALLSQTLLVGSAQPDEELFTLNAENKVMTQEEFDGHGTDLLKGIVPLVRDNNGAFVYTAESETAPATDGKIDTYFEFFNTMAYKDGPEASLVYELAQPSVIDTIVVYSNNGAQTTDRFIGKYELYLSLTEEDLFSEENRVLAYDNTAQPASLQTLEAAEGQTVRAKFFGMKILQPKVNMEGEGSAAALIRELGVFGEPCEAYELTESNVNTTTETGAQEAQAAYEALGDSRIHGQLATLKRADGTVFTYGTNASSWTDGTIAASGFIEGGAGTTLTYDLGESLLLDKVYIHNHPGPENTAYMVGQYELYAADSEEELFQEENRIASHDSTASPKAAQLFTFLEGSKPAGRYFGIKILKCTVNGDELIRFKEIGVYTQEKPAYTVTAQRTLPAQTDFDALGENYLKGRTPVKAEMDKDDATSTFGGTFAGWTDGDTSTAGESYGGDTGTTGADELRIAYDLGERIRIHKLVLCGHPDPQIGSSNSDKRYYNSRVIGDYELYVSDNEVDLFTPGNKAAEYKNCLYGTVAQTFDFAGEGAPAGRYVGIRVLSLTVDPTINDSVRLKEIGVFGEPGGEAAVTIETAKDITQEELDALGDSLIEGLTPVVRDNTDTVVTPGPEGTNTIANWTDGNAGTSYMLAKDAAYRDGPHATFLYDLGGLTEIDRLLIYHHPPTLPQYNTGHYKIYVSEEQEALFDAANVVLDYDNTQGTTAVQQVVFSTDKPTGRFVGIEVLQQTAGTASEAPPEDGIRLRELAVYGTAVEVPDYVVETTSSLTQEQMDALGDSLVEGQIPIVRDNGNQDVERIPEESGRTIVNWTDGDLASSFWLPKSVAYKTGPSVGIVFTLDELTEIDTILLAHHSTTTYSAGEYKIFVSSKLEDIFAGYNEVAYYNNMTNTQTAQIIRFQNEKPRGTYVGIQVLTQTVGNPGETPPDDGIRFREFGIYGSSYVPQGTNLLANVPSDAYWTAADGTREKLDDTQFTVEDRKRLTNGLYTAEDEDAVRLATQGKQLDIVYNLCKNMQIDELRLIQPEDTARIVREYKVYAGMTAEDVWEEDALVGHFKAAADSGQITSFSFDESKEMRFVRFSILDTGEEGYCSLGELEAIGLDSQQPKNGNMLVGLTDQNVTAYYENQSTYDLTPLTQFPQKSRYEMEDMLDGLSTTLLDFYGGKHGEETMDLLFYLGGLKAINTLEYIGHPGALEYNAREVRYYIGETEEEMFGEDAVPVAVFEDPTGEIGQHSIEIPPVVGRYLRVSIVDPCAEDRVLQGTDVTVITDITAMGISVEGYTDPSGDESVVKSFTDAETGIKVDIMKLDMGDVYTKPAYMKLVFQPLTQMQQDSLALMGLSGYGNSFTVQFYTVDDELITSLGGRSIRVTMPLPPVDEDFYFGKVWPEEVAIMDAEMLDGALRYVDADLRTTTYVLACFGTPGGDPADPDGPDIPPTGGRLPVAAGGLALLSLPAVVTLRKRKSRPTAPKGQ